jgi:hypothetical protein
MSHPCGHWASTEGDSATIETNEPASARGSHLRQIDLFGLWSPPLTSIVDRVELYFVFMVVSSGCSAANRIRSLGHEMGMET